MADQRVELLSNVSLFANSSKRQVRNVLPWTKEYKYKSGAAMVKEGAVGRDLFLILEGNAKVVRGSRTITRLGPGDYFGEIALIDERPRTASVIADGPVDCLVIRQSEFKALLAGDPEIAWNMLRAFAARFRAD